jgi:hypothetical protein
MYVIFFIVELYLHDVKRMLKETMLSFTYKLSNQGSRIKTEEHSFSVVIRIGSKSQNPSASTTTIATFLSSYLCGR